MDATDYQTAVIRGDGRTYCNGQNNGYFGPLEMPWPPSGTRYIDVAMGSTFTLGLLSDGTLLGAGNLPVLPVQVPGLSYVDCAAGDAHALLLRSDGLVIAIGDNVNGQCNVPQFPPGVVATKVVAEAYHSVILLSDGSIVAFGYNLTGQCNVLPLPQGLRYVDVDTSTFHTVAVRSDGALVAWGDNTYGQCNVPAGAFRMAAAGDAHTVGWRMDGAFIAFGNNGFGQCNVPALAAGLECEQIACGYAHTVALMSDGSVLAWGNDSFHQCLIPTIPADPELGGPARIRSASAGGPNTACVLSDGSLRVWGHSYLASMPLPFLNEKIKRVELGWGFALALRDDGALLGWGDNTFGQASPPPLPSGVSYTDFDACWSHAVALRSDGMAVQFGSFNGPIPALPGRPGSVPFLRYIDADAEDRQTVLLRSDGAILVVGNSSYPYLSNVPPSPPGLAYVQVAACGSFHAALRSDGEVVLWGTSASLPTLPAGVSYVEISGGDQVVVGRRSDGQVRVSAAGLGRLPFVPPLDPGTSYVEVDGGNVSIAARVGPTSTYVTFANGCAGSGPASRLVPADTPRIGNALKVRVFDLPENAAALVLGFARTSPVPLDGLGLPGCTGHVTIDAIDIAVGQLGSASFSLPIPDDPLLIGVHFFHQALVFDQAAGNPAGAVVSNAAEGVVGDW